MPRSRRPSCARSSVRVLQCSTSRAAPMRSQRRATMSISCSWTSHYPTSTGSKSADRCATGTTGCRSSSSPPVPRSPTSSPAWTPARTTTSPNRSGSRSSWPGCACASVSRRPWPATVQEVRVDPSAHRAWQNDKELDLTPKEFDLLALLVTDAGRVVSRQRIMHEVWDEHYYGSTRTLDMHISSLRRKLGDDPTQPRFISTVRGVGFRFETG